MWVWVWILDTIVSQQAIKGTREQVRPAKQVNLSAEPTRGSWTFIQCLDP